MPDELSPAGHCAAAASLSDAAESEHMPSQRRAKLDQPNKWGGITLCFVCLFSWQKPTTALIKDEHNCNVDAVTIT